jgi:RNA polymerase sigma-70 factor (ECF subfamily)
VTPDEERRATDLMRRALQGESAPYADLLVVLTAVTRRFARARLGPVAWLDDVVQETLLTVHVARHTYDASRPFAPWFYAIARSRLVDAVRRERRISGRELGDPAVMEPAEAAAAGPSGHSRNDIDVEAIRRALDALPARQRDVVEGLKYRDESVRDIAARLGLTESAVKVTAHRGYRALKRLLGGKRS